MRTLASRHGILAVHLLITILLVPGLVAYTGAAYLHYIALYLAVLLASYVLLQRFLPVGRPIGERPVLSAVAFIRAVLVAQVALMAAHWAYLGGIPLWEALHQKDDLAIVDIRRSAGEDVPTALAYASHFMIKAFVPFALLLAWTGHRRLFWALAVTAGLYAASLLAKSFVVTLFVPLWIAFLLGRHWGRFLGLSAVFALLIVALSTAANPQKLATVEVGEQGRTEAVDEGVKKYGFLGDAVLGVGSRILLMPGHTVAEWFMHIPADLPHAKGAAIRPWAVAQGKPYVDYSEKIYDLAYPEMAEKQVPGTMGSASFMYGYANFGAWGLAGSGLITAIWLLLVQRVFGGRWRWALALNTFPLLALSASALPTVLLTHGWLPTIVLFLVLCPSNEPGE
ncbi:MAG TPA: hypothetical protein PKD45_13060 [Flavobacteriales bacterium]|nr:hypothetical protein [Flavobacteriales bacterium]